MKHHEREFFISLIRSGKYFLKNLIIKSLTIDQSVIACRIYNEALDQAYIDGMMDEQEIEKWMRDQELWTIKDDEKLEGLKKDIERLKIEIYNSRSNKDLKEKIRLYIRAGENQLASHFNKKNQYYLNTCEGYASVEKLSWIIKNTTYENDKLYDFDDTSLSYVMDEYQSFTLSESKIRELARSEPWKSLWVVHEKAQATLFVNEKNQELTSNQKNLIIWSQTYDNIQESLDCPQKEVIEDDDMLDGWFILQSQKRERETNEKEFEDSVQNEKIKNSSEVFVMANNSQDITKIDKLNNPHSSMIKKQREQLIKTKGSVTQDQFADERLNLQMQTTNKLRGRS